jgi:hypothetical protein
MKRAQDADLRRINGDSTQSPQDDCVNATCDNLCKIDKLGGVEAPGCVLIPKDPEVT